MIDSTFEVVKPVTTFRGFFYIGAGKWKSLQKLIACANFEAQVYFNLVVILDTKRVSGDDAMVVFAGPILRGRLYFRHSRNAKMANGFFLQIVSMDNILLSADMECFDGAGADGIGVGGGIIFQKHDFLFSLCFFELVHFGEEVFVKSVVHFGDVINAA